jgi:hypothetical protein
VALYKEHAAMDQFGAREMTRIVALLLLLVSACSGRSQLSSNTTVGGVGGFDGSLRRLHAHV